MDDKIELVVERLKKARSILFVTGAGISAESGLPTYRGIGGLYNDENKLVEGVTIEEAISGDMINSKPDITWKYILEIEKSVRGAKHNKAHEIISKFEKKFERVWVLTQNIDGFHKQAGSKNLIEIHGEIYKIRCRKCDYINTIEDYSVFDEIPPSCPKCGDILRPNVVLFGENLDLENLMILETQLRKGFDVVFSIGTTSVFPYIAQPVILSKHNNSLSVEINPGQTSVSSIVDVKIRDFSKKTLSKIWEKIK